MGIFPLSNSREHAPDDYFEYLTPILIFIKMTSKNVHMH